MRTRPFAPVVLAAALVACQQASGAAGTHHEHRARDRGIQPAHAVLTGIVPGTFRGYRSLVRVVDARRSLPRPGTGVLIRLAGIGALHVRCDARPRGRFRLTAFAAGEGPPTVFREARSIHGRRAITGAVGSVSGLTGKLAMTLPPGDARRGSLERYEIAGGGEAFQFVATVSALIAVSDRGCDLLAEATVVTHGPFYRYALAKG